MIRTYTELMQIPEFIDRYRYLKIGGTIGHETFGRERWLNQRFYTSNEWRNFRREIMVRDLGYDLAHPDRPFGRDEKVYIHHLNPIIVTDVRDMTEMLMDPENAICTSFTTHQAIHFGDESLLGLEEPIIRSVYDTCPWRM